MVFARGRAGGGLRLGITATRKAGSAVVRNRARRRVREIFRRWAATALGVGVDLVVNISERATVAPFAALSSEVTALLSRAAARRGEMNTPGRVAPARALAGVLDAYKRFVSPLLPPACRFTPTCSEYAREAVTRHGVWRGLALAARRLARCHPFHAGGPDPVP